MKTIEEVVAFADTVKGYMYPVELRWLAETARGIGRATSWCEVGSWQGRSATATAGGLYPGSRLVLVDNFTGPTTREAPNAQACKRRLRQAVERMRVFSPGVNIEVLFGFSAQVSKNIPDASLDVIFIDGDHAYPAVVADIKSWRPKMKSGALMCGHDFTNKCGVEPAVRELLPQFGQVAGTSIWFTRV